MSEIRDALKMAQGFLSAGDVARAKEMIDALVAAGEPPFDYVLAHERQCEGLRELNAAVEARARVP
jgi:hypothetical protein